MSALVVAASTGDAYEVRINGRMEGQQTTNVWHFVCAGADPDVLTHLILVFVQCFIDNLLPVLSSSWALEEVRWKRVSPTLGPEFVSVPVGAGAGAGGAAALPSYASLVLSLRSNEGGRSKRGRKYIAGLPETATINSQFDTTNAFWAAALAFAACVLAAFVVGDPPGAPSWQIVVYSRKIGGATLPYGAAGFTGIHTILPQQILGTTRSRKLGVGS
jgi:hypothetical protein